MDLEDIDEEIKLESPKNWRMRKAISSKPNYDDLVHPDYFSMKGQFMRQLKKKLDSFLANSLQDNLFLASIVLKLSHLPQPSHMEGTPASSLYSFVYDCSMRTSLSTMLKE